MAHNEIINRSYQKLINQLGLEERKKVRTRSIVQEGMFNRGGTINNFKNAHNQQKCLLPGQYCTINAWGDVLLCCNDYFSEYSFCNIKTSSLLDIWNNEDFIEIRKEIAHGILKFPICKQCKLSSGVHS